MTESATSHIKGIAILGATGSIGQSTLEVIALHPQKYKVIALSAYSNVELLLQQCLRFQPEYAVMVDKKSAQQLEKRLAEEGEYTIHVLSGAKSLNDMAALEQVDYVMAAIVGAAGLASTLKAAEKGKRILLANKESLVMSGALLMDAVDKGGAELLPIDSEHNAIFQCMPELWKNRDEQLGIEKILLTASGGPFWEYSLEQLKYVTPEQACKHPNWNMGRKISVDSATMMNKGLEVIEASWLFSMPAEHIEVVVHPQSIIHSMVSYSDGSVLAQLGNPDMRTPIAHALAWPERTRSGVDALDIFAIGKLTFQAADLQRFPCLRLAYDALRSGKTAPTILNAANEVAVAAFLQQQLAFQDIAVVIDFVLSELNLQDANTLDAVIAADKAARFLAQQKISTLH